MKNYGFTQLFVIALLASLWAHGSMAGTPPLSFRAWKKQQISEVKKMIKRTKQTKTVDVKVKIQEPPPEAVTAELENTRMPTTTVESSAKSAMTEMEKLQEMLKYTQELTTDDYLAVYLSRYRDDDRGISEVAKKLSKDEVHSFLKMLIKLYDEKRSRDENTRTSPDEFTKAKAEQQVSFNREMDIRRVFSGARQNAPNN